MKIWVVPGVIPNGVATAGQDFRHQFGMGLGLFTDQEERSGNLMFSQHLKDVFGLAHVRAIVERQDDSLRWRGGRDFRLVAAGLLENLRGNIDAVLKAFEVVFPNACRLRTRRMSGWCGLFNRDAIDPRIRGKAWAGDQQGEDQQQE